MTGIWSGFDSAEASRAAELGLAGVSAGVALMGRRSRAITDYWNSVGAVCEPTDLLALQLGYWSQWLDDYAQAWSQSLAPLSSPPPPGEAMTTAPADDAQVITRAA